MDHLVERMRAAPCDEIVVVTRPDKRDVAAHAAAAGARVVLARPATVAESLLAGAAELADDDVVLIGFPDTLWEPLDGFARLLDELAGGWRAVLGLFTAPVEDLRRYQPVAFAPDGSVERIEIRPAEPSSAWTWGLAVMTVRELRRLDPAEDPGTHFGRLARDGSLGAVRLSDRFLDIGTPDGLAQALTTGRPAAASGR
jgi:NDP-sugar pyrophosphorylase family protein